MIDTALRKLQIERRNAAVSAICRSLDVTDRQFRTILGNIRNGGLRRRIKDIPIDELKQEAIRVKQQDGEIRRALGKRQVPRRAHGENGEKPVSASDRKRLWYVSVQRKQEEQAGVVSDDLPRVHAPRPGVTGFKYQNGPEFIDRLIELYAHLGSYSKVADRLGMTKGQIMGIMWRAGQRGLDPAGRAKREAEKKMRRDALARLISAKRRAARHHEGNVPKLVAVAAPEPKPQPPSAETIKRREVNTDSWVFSGKSTLPPLASLTYGDD